MPNMLKAGAITFGTVVLALLLVLGAVLGWITHRKAQFDSMEDTRDLAKQAAEMADTYLSKRPRGALVIGIYQRGNRWVGGFGSVDNGSEAQKPDGDSVFEIGSITKAFTGLLLSRMVEAGTVELTNRIDRFLPDGMTLDAGRGSITLVELATHNSGLPRLPDNFWTKVAMTNENPYADYTAPFLFEDLTKVKLSRPPGDGYDYSNYGAALLGELLANAAGTTYDRLLTESIIAPFKMTNTTLVVNDAQRARLVPGHKPNGERTANWDFDVMAPAGGLKSGANDLLRFIDGNLHPTDPGMSNSVARALSVHGSSSNDKMGLGWHRQATLEGQTIWWHNGGTGGYASFLGMDLDHDLGVIVLSNHGDVFAGRYDVDRIGMNLLRLAVKVSLE